MEELYNMEISRNTLLSMIENNPEIKELSQEEVILKKQILESIGCNQSQIINIISSNSLYLTKTNKEIIDLINYLKEIGFSTLNILFDSNPYIFNLEPFEIKKYIIERQNEGKELEDIIDDLESNTYLFFEM